MFTLLRHQYRAVAYILTHSVNLAFGPKSGFKNKCRAEFGLVILGFKIRPIYSSVSNTEYQARSSNSKLKPGNTVLPTVILKTNFYQHYKSRMTAFSKLSRTSPLGFSAYE